MIAWETVAIRLAVALAFGAFIGIEREWRLKQAGLKTMTLVSLGAAAFAMVSNTFGNSNHNPGQIAAAVVGGIGFIGAGLIMHRGLTVQGLTTAATLWADASVGVATGLGQFSVAVSLTVAIVIIQLAGRGAEKKLRRMRREKIASRFELRVDFDPDALPAVTAAWEPYGPEVRRSLQRGMDVVTGRVVLRAKGEMDFAALEEKLLAIDGVKRIDLRYLGIDED